MDLSAVRTEEALVSTIHSVADLHRWEQAEDAQVKLGAAVIGAKPIYEVALRVKFFNF